MARDGSRAAIDELWQADETDEPVVEAVIAALDRGDVRVAEKSPEGWVVNEWVKKAILLYFRLRNWWSRWTSVASTSSTRSR